MSPAINKIQFGPNAIFLSYPCHSPQVSIHHIELIFEQFKGNKMLVQIKYVTTFVATNMQFLTISYN